MKRILSGNPDQEATDRVLALLDLTDVDSKKAKKLSIGMKQRLGIAQALLNDPEVIVLDETTAR